MAAGLCLSSIWMDELVQSACHKGKTKIRHVLGNSRKPQIIFAGPLGNAKQKARLSSCCIKIQASSTAKCVFKLTRTMFQIKFKMMYIAIGRKDSSKSRMENTTSWLFNTTLVCWLSRPPKVPCVYFPNVEPSLPPHHAV